MNTSQNPLIRPGTPFERRVVEAIDRAKTGRSVGTFTRPLPGGVSQTVQKQRRQTSSLKPLEIVSASRLKIKVITGSILGAMPTIGGVRLDSSTAPTITVPETGTRYVVGNITGTPVNTTITTSLGTRVFFHPTMSSIVVTITLETTAPTSADLFGSTGIFKIHLGTVNNGTSIFNNGYGPITGFVQDQLDGSGNGTLVLNHPGT
jgi:hypothetical protein